MLKPFLNVVYAVMAVAGFNCTCFDPDLDPIFHGLRVIFKFFLPNFFFYFVEFAVV